jgi:hypothetical protein
MQFHPNELFLLYNPHSNGGKQTKAMAMDICSHINEVDALHQKLIPTILERSGNPAAHGSR